MVCDEGSRSLVWAGFAGCLVEWVTVDLTLDQMGF